MDLNVLIRGQSNALLFADRGGAAALEQGLEARLPGVDVHMLYRWDTDANTIFSATAFMDWDTDGEQASLLRFVNGLSADLKDNPTLTLWMHNEYDQKTDGLTTAAWLGEVRADAALVRGAFGQGAGTTPYEFVPIRYPYGGSYDAIKSGMDALAADGSFNASESLAALSLAMNGGPEPGNNGSHMGDADAVKLGGDLAPGMAEILRPLAGGSTTVPPPSPSPTPTTPTPVQTTIGSGTDSLVLSVSQDAYQGSAQYTVKVDGTQIGGTLTASALHASGQHDTVTIKGDWAAGGHTATLTFLNDAYGGSAATDRNLYVESATYNGAAVGGAAKALLSNGPASFGFTEAATTTTPTTPTTPTTTQPASVTVGTGADKLVLSVSQDAYQGSAQYTVSVDGQQIGGTLTASALHGSGQTDTVSVLGDWAAGGHTVSVNFLNDAWGGTAATDRNLYVESATYNGAAVGGAAKSLLSSGPASFGFTEAAPATTTPTAPTSTQPANLTVGSGSDALVLSVSQDAYQGSAQYTVTVDGQQIGGTLTASALHSSGQHDTVTVKGDWAAGNHTATVNFVNDAYGGTATTDRNLYLDGATYNGAALGGAAKSLLSNGPASFGFTEAATPTTPTTTTTQPASLAVGAGADKLVLSVSQDAYQGSAQYTVKVDGTQIGGTLTASALHSSGQHDTVTVLGNWSQGSHAVSVTFLNDAYGGTADTDRNLYVDSATYDGAAVSGATAALFSAGSAGFGFVDPLA